jgi:integrase
VPRAGWSGSQHGAWRLLLHLRQRSATAARALEFLILTATRTSETLLAQWSEIDFGARVWTIPADRMKAGKLHRVPLSDAAMEILQNMRGVQQGDFVFPGMKPGRPLSNMALLTLLDRMDYAGITSHGFRSTFRDWAGEHAKIPREVAEAMLAHVIRDRSEAAYARSDLLERRRPMMALWAQYCRDAAGAGERVDGCQNPRKDGATKKVGMTLAVGSAAPCRRTLGG